MSPTIQHDDYVISVASRFTRYRINDIVLVKHPKFQRIIKRIIELKLDGSILLAGDNSNSTSSSKIGWLNHSDVIGKVKLHISPSKLRLIRN